MRIYRLILGGIGVVFRALARDGGPELQNVRVEWVLPTTYEIRDFNTNI